MNKTAFSKILMIFGILCYVDGYLLDNLYSTFLGVFIFIYLYFTEKITNLKIDMISIIEEGDKLKEHVSSNILIKVYKNSTVPSLRFKSKHAHISLNDIKEKGNEINYLMTITPYKKEELVIEALGEIYDKRMLNFDKYLKSLSFKVSSSVKGFMHSAGKEEILKSTISGIVEPEVDELKTYEIGEDFKKIDWKKSIAVGNLIIRKMVYQEDIHIYYLIDTGYCMRRATDLDRNKINYVVEILLDFLNISGENDSYVFLYDDYKLIKSYMLGKKKMLKSTGGNRGHKHLKEFKGELLNIKPILIGKCILPNSLDNIDKSFNMKMDDSIILHTYLSKKKKGSNGILECARHLMRLKTGTVMVFTDLDSNVIPLLKSVSMLSKKGYRVIIYGIYTPSFNIKKDDLANEEILKNIYQHYINRLKIIRSLRKKGAMVIDLTYNDNINSIMKKLKRSKKI